MLFHLYQTVIESSAAMPELNQIKAMVIDKDGVLFRGETPLPGMGDLLTLLRRRSIPFIIATNNTTLSPEDFCQQLANMGLSIEIDEILTAGQAAAQFLQTQLPQGAPIYVIGEPPLHTALDLAGFELRDRADGTLCVVVGLDRHVTWNKLTEACLAIQRGARFIGTNPDRTLPIERGFAPGNGALLALLEAATGTQPMIVGKPEPLLYLQALRRLGTQAIQTLALGDRLETDILGGKRAGMLTALVLTGASQTKDLEGAATQPDWVFKDLPELCQALSEGAS
jgi:4-nitrophenyl phosphatase